MARLPQDYNAHRHAKGQGKHGGATMRLVAVTPHLPDQLRRAAIEWDREHQDEQATVFIAPSRYPSAPGKLLCSRCGTARRADALVDGVCRYRPKCDLAIGEDRHAGLL